MSVNSSSFEEHSFYSEEDYFYSKENSSSHFPNPDYVYLFQKECFQTTLNSFILSLAAILYTLLLLPLIILVLYLGYQKSRKPRSSSTATSHSDHFTYHSIFMQLIQLLGIVIFFIGTYFFHHDMLDVGNSLLDYTSVGQALFHLLTCVERYLAVVHPITYLVMKQGDGVRIRNISIGCVWFLSIGYIALWYEDIKDLHAFVTLCFLVLLIGVLFFCSFAVLYVLKRPGPGEGGGTMERVDQSKQRAFYTIMAIMGVLLLRFGGNLIIYALSVSTVQTPINALSDSTVQNPINACFVTMSSFWFGLPSSLVLPLLFLNGAGKLQCCKQNTESG